jgi:parallel beta-helix repeat protein
VFENDIGIEVHGQSNNNVLTWNNVSDNSFGIRLGSSLSTIVSQNNVTSNDYGIDISDSSNGNRIAGNNITNNVYGIMLSDSSRNNVLGNDMINNHAGIYLGQSSNNSITENKITNNGYGIMFAESSNNSIAGNNIIANNYDGIWLVLSSNNNSIAGNNIVANNRHGIWLWDSSNNRIFHNNFIDNALQAFAKLANVWDDGYPSGGNYWSDCADIDVYHGPNQDLPSMDGIYDHPYVIDADNNDRYPLVKPYPIIPVTVDVNSDTLNLKSKGEWITCYIELPESYNVSDIDIYSIRLNDTLPVSLLPNPPVPVPTEIGDYDNDGIPDLMVKFNRTEVSSWIYDDLGIQYGNVTLTITGEVDGTPFEGTDMIKVLFPGDADDDGDVDRYDFSLFAGVYGTAVESPVYNWHADFNEDQNIDRYDFSILAEYYGKTAV